MEKKMKDSWGKELVDWYKNNHRDLPFRKTKDAYCIWISEIMAQQTRIEALLKYYNRWMERFCSLEDIATCTQDELYQYWEGLGYYSRVRNIQKTAQICCEKYDGHLPRTYDALLALPGIGTYTAAAISSISYGEVQCAIDGNVLRVYSRLYEDADDVLSQKMKRKVQQALQSIILQEEPGLFNNALMELGAMVCIPNGQPHCEQCPLMGWCQAHQHHTQLSYPVKKAKKARKIEEHEAYIVYHDGKYGIRKRPSKGLLAGLYEFPHRIIETGTDAKEERFTYRHIFSHIEWNVHVCCVSYLDEFDGIWVTYDELMHQYPIPSAFEPIRKYIRDMEKDKR